jgi:hypothetical protein
MAKSIIETSRVKRSNSSPTKRLCALLALFAPVTLSLLVIFSNYEWIWYKTEHATSAGLVALLLSWVCMCAGLAMWGLSRPAQIRWATRLALLMVIGQMLSFAIDALSVSAFRLPLGDGREVLALGRGGFGGSWVDVYVTEPRWGVLLRPTSVVQYDRPMVESLAAAADGGFDVSLSEYGKPGWVEHWSPSDIAAAKVRAEQRCRLC